MWRVLECVILLVWGDFLGLSGVSTWILVGLARIAFVSHAWDLLRRCGGKEGGCILSLFVLYNTVLTVGRGRLDARPTDTYVYILVALREGRSEVDNATRVLLLLLLLLAY